MWALALAPCSALRRGRTGKQSNSAGTKTCRHHYFRAWLQRYTKAPRLSVPCALESKTIACACRSLRPHHLGCSKTTPAIAACSLQLTKKHALPRRTSKMSHDRSGRAACLRTIRIHLLQFENAFDSTRRDRCGRWLWRLVRPVAHFTPDATRFNEIWHTVLSALRSPRLAARSEDK